MNKFTEKKYVCAGLEVIINKTGFGTAVQQLILVQRALYPDEPSGVTF